MSPAIRTSRAISGPSTSRAGGSASALCSPGASVPRRESGAYIGGSRFSLGVPASRPSYWTYSGGSPVRPPGCWAVEICGGLPAGGTGARPDSSERDPGPQERARRAARHRERPAVVDGDLAGDGQAQPGAARVPGPGFVEAGEPVEDRVVVLGRDARPVVLDLEHGLVVALPKADDHGARGVPHGVVDEVRHQPSQLLGGAAHDDPGADPESDADVGARPGPGGLLRGDLPQVDLGVLGWLACVEPGEQQQVGGEALDPLDV